MRTFVKTFKPRFAPLVEAGTKLQTVRPTPKRDQDMPHAGDRISCREWTGKPYASKQRMLREGIIERVAHCEITNECVIVNSQAEPLQAFANADGFADEFEMWDWFKKTHGLPFEGILIRWRNDA